ncbi:MAG: Long-chain-fatty-acid--CoA ligase [uncultured Acetobacteraceae bacterium]|uniref:Long-chain-fatty-acid--CoA ligase n=1 Tax=uncultured Acetobacteraceae bacterium TaxID=169975 RepID=A0A6J4J6A9_9PROT|nr:MAG: Long-chain-fatty-acid--CoA ligase [uncultured Acetobacteraceae bacterium]
MGGATVAAVGADAGPDLDLPWLRSYPPGVDWDMPFPAETLPEMFDAAVARFGARTCMDFMGRRWSFTQMGALVDSAAAGFKRLGVEPGTRVGLCLPNSPFFVAAFFGALKAGAVVVNYSPLYVEEELAFQMRDSGTEVMVTVDLDPLLPRVLALLDRPGSPLKHVVACQFSSALPMGKGLAFRVLRRKSIAPVPRGDGRVVPFKTLSGKATPPVCGARPGDVALLQYTGGTTGVPKGVMLTHANLCANVRQSLAWNTAMREGEERILAVLPFFHIYALTAVMIVSIVRGSTLIALPRFDFEAVMAAIRRCRPTMIPGVPTLFKALLDKGATKEDLSSLRSCVSGGAPLPAQVKDDFEARSGCSVTEGYGLTEASPVCLSNPPGEGNRAGTIGLPVPATRAEIRSLEDPSRALPVGEKGELCIAGPQVMAGYWNRPEETAAVLGADGFLRTGDVGIMDQHGYVTLVDRIKDLILVSGFNVYPRAIEEALYRHPDVAAVTVVGMPDEYRGEAPAAFVEPRPGATLTEEALRGFLKDKLSPVEMPRLIEVRDALPRSTVGKLTKVELRAEVLQRAAATAAAAQ